MKAAVEQFDAERGVLLSPNRAAAGADGRVRRRDAMTAATRQPRVGPGGRAAAAC
jgi:hypothetical protein